CTAVGDYWNGTSDQTLVESWNGASWFILSSPNSGTSDNILYGVSCVSQTSCTAVGQYSNGTSDQTLVESWNGFVASNSSWSIVPSPNSGIYNNSLSGVSCVSQTSCTAVGDYWNGTSDQTLVESATYSAPAITSANTADFAVNKTNTFSVTATGFPAPSLSESGALPSGLSFNPTTGVLSSTSSLKVAGIYEFTLQASNGVSPNATQSFTLVVAKGKKPAVTSKSSTKFYVAVASSFTINTKGFPVPSITETGTLPTGVGFVDNGNGTATISGTPAAGTAGTYKLHITATNVVGSKSKALKLTVVKT
ncbi:MAG TPA: Ig domain-containing protein, partial [Acidimicrobiales bacterium]|nr:Ig domain-containing protein [Acidimicrobiales bacterium]